MTPHAPAMFLVLALATGPARAADSEGQLAGGSATRVIQPPISAPPIAEVLQRAWRWSLFGGDLGGAGLSVTDLEGDGRPEVIASFSPTRTGSAGFHVLRWRGAALGYEISWNTPYWGNLLDGNGYPLRVGSLVTAQVDGDPAQEILVTLGSRILVYDGATLTVQQELTSPTAEVHLLHVVDVDGDGTLELVYLGPHLYVQDLATGAVEVDDPAHGGIALTVGNADLDPGPEIVVSGSSGSTGWVLDGRTRAVKWANPAGFGKHVRVGDIDGNGRPDVVVAENWQRISVYDGAAQALLGTVPTAQDIGALELIDVNEGAVEIVYADAQGRDIWAIDGTTRLPLWSIESPDNGVRRIVVADADGDGSQELLWGAGFDTTGPDHLYVHDLATLAREWRSDDLAGGNVPEIGDIDGDGRREVLHAAAQSEHGYAGGLALAHDPLTGHRKWQSTPWLPWPSVLTRLIAANVDVDPQDEVFVATEEFLICYDWVRQAEQWRWALPPTEDTQSLVTLAVGDVDLDGKPELVATASPSAWPTTGSFLYIIDAASGLLEWRSPAFPLVFLDHPYLSQLRIGNVDADPQPDIVVGAEGRRVYVIDGISHEIRSIDAFPSALDLVDRNHDGRLEIAVADQSGTIALLDASTGAVLEVPVQVDGGITSLAVADLDGDGDIDYLFGFEGEVWLASGSCSPVGTGPIGGTGVDSLRVGDVNGDGAPEVLVGSSSGLDIYWPTGRPGPQDEGAGTVQIAVHRACAAVPATIPWTTTPGTATSDTDFEVSGGTLSFAAGQTTATATVRLIDDQLDEEDETFALRLQGSDGTPILSVPVTIRDDDATPTVTAGGWLGFPEGDGLGRVYVPLLLSAPTTFPVTVHVWTEDDSARQGLDYAEYAGDIVFPAGTTTATVPIRLLGDCLPEPKERFLLRLLPVAGAGVAEPEVAVTILDDDNPRQDYSRAMCGSKR